MKIQPPAFDVFGFARGVLKYCIKAAIPLPNHTISLAMKGPDGAAQSALRRLLRGEAKTYQSQQGIPSQPKNFQN